jgi:hypothetical protein
MVTYDLFTSFFLSCQVPKEYITKPLRLQLNDPFHPILLLVLAYVCVFDQKEVCIHIDNGTMLNLCSLQLQLEIICNEWPICPSATLGRLLEHWLSRRPKHEVQAAVGSPAKEFVMELHYRRRLAAVSLCCIMKTKSVTTSLPCYCST